MTILDATAVIAFLRDEPAAAEVETLLELRECTLTTFGLAEAVDHLVRVGGWDEEGAVVDVAALGLVPALEVGTTSAVQAALFRARHYNRRTRVVSLPDCVAAYAARSTNSALATSDRHLLDLCHDEGIAVIPLPDSKGNVWSPG